MKPPKFLIAHNEAAQPGAAFIVHTQEPAFVGQIIIFTNAEELHEYVSKNECIIVNEQVIVHIMKNFTSNKISRFEGLKKRLTSWMLANWVQK